MVVPHPWMSDWVRCLACGTAHNLEMCPNRYMSPHTEAFLQRVVDEMVRLGWDGDPKTAAPFHRPALENLWQSATTTSCG